MIIYGYYSIKMGFFIYDYLWLFYGHWWLLMIIDDYLWLLIITDDYFIFDIGQLFFEKYLEKLIWLI